MKEASFITFLSGGGGGIDGYFRVPEVRERVERQQRGRDGCTGSVAFAAVNGRQRA
jgi:hypothetical protein